jgi:hypothetical protein
VYQERSSNTSPGEEKDVFQTGGNRKPLTRALYGINRLYWSIYCRESYGLEIGLFDEYVGSPRLNKIILSILAALAIAVGAAGAGIPLEELPQPEFDSITRYST